MRILNFANRNLKEIIRDPLSIIFAILLPLFLLFIFQQFEIPNEVYQIENFTPGIVVFSFSFITLFTAMLVAKDRGTSLLTRLGISPMRPIEYVLGYILAVLPIIILQNILFFVGAICLGLHFNMQVIYTILASIPLSVLFISLGILIGSFTTEKSASGVSSIVVQLVAFTSGMYFSVDMIGKFFASICNFLPFYHCVYLLQGLLNHHYQGLLDASIVVILYTFIALGIAVIVFQRKVIDHK